MEPKTKNISILLIFLFAIVSSIIPSLVKIGLYVMVPILLICAFNINKRFLFDSKYTSRYGIIIIWMLLASIISDHSDIAFSGFIPILASYLLCCSMMVFSKGVNNIKWFYTIYIIFYLALLIYLYLNAGLISSFAEGTRVGGIELNANTYAYYLFFATISANFLLYLRKKVGIFDILIYLGILVLSSYIALITASRQVLLIQLPVILVLSIIRFKSALSGKMTIPLLLVFGTILIFVLYPKFADIYQGSYLAQRNELVLGDDERSVLLQQAIQVGCQNPVFGVGPRCFSLYSSGNHFSHCSFTELFACGGIVPSLLFISILLLFIKNQYVRYRQLKDRYFLLFLFFGIFFLIDNMFYVFYDVPWMIAFFYLVAGHSEAYYKQSFGQ